jgi:bacterial/archaeal transporter family protein
MIARWGIWTAVALGSWGCWALISKLIGDALTPSMSQAVSTLGLLPIMCVLAWVKGPAPTGNPRAGAAWGFAAGALTCVGNIAYYAVLNSGAKAATVVPLTALYPLVTVLLAVALLREKLNWIQVAGVAAAFIAIWFFNVPQEGAAVNSWLAVAMAPIFLWGVSGLLQKISTNHISGERSALWFLAAFVPVAGILLLREGAPANVSPRTWRLALLLGLTFAFGNFAILQAFARGGKASIIAPLAGLYPMVSIPIAVLALGEKISARETAGIVTALVAVAAISVETKAELKA